jgi:hypothetical protein
MDVGDRIEGRGSVIRIEPDASVFLKMETRATAVESIYMFVAKINQGSGTLQALSS